MCLLRVRMVGRDIQKTHPSMLQKRHIYYAKGPIHSIHPSLHTFHRIGFLNPLARSQFTRLPKPGGMGRFGTATGGCGCDCDWMTPPPPPPPGAASSPSAAAAAASSFFVFLSMRSVGASVAWMRLRSESWMIAALLIFSCSVERDVVMGAGG